MKEHRDRVAEPSRALPPSQALWVWSLRQKWNEPVRCRSLLAAQMYGEEVHPWARS